jgi:hypothetical protein
MFQRPLNCRGPLSTVEAHKFWLKEHFQWKDSLLETLNYNKDTTFERTMPTNSGPGYILCGLEYQESYRAYDHSAHPVTVRWNAI